MKIKVFFKKVAKNIEIREISEILRFSKKHLPTGVGTKKKVSLPKK